MNAKELAALIHARKVSAREVMAAHLERINRLNAKVNAIVAKLDDDKCLALADAADQRARGDSLPPLHGLPIAFKDLQTAVGFPFTRGSPIYRDAMPEQDSVVVERLRNAGAIAIGKTNVPEFGMGSHTYNKVYGTTFNPYDLTKSAGGSSGGAAAALASGMLPIADGTDLGGSLRNPANFNNVVALRPTVGLVPTWPAADAWATLSVDGPMGRTVADVALLLGAIAGPDPRSPISLAAPLAAGDATLERDFHRARVAPRVAGRRDQVKDTIRWELERGERLTAAEIEWALTKRTELFHRIRQFMERYAFFVLPTTQVPPFDVDRPYP